MTYNREGCKKQVACLCFSYERENDVGLGKCICMIIDIPALFEYTWVREASVLFYRPQCGFLHFCAGCNGCTIFSWIETLDGLWCSVQ